MVGVAYHIPPKRYGRMIAFKVLKPGLHSTFQDAGRFGYAHFGVPCSGPMDPWHAQQAVDTIEKAGAARLQNRIVLECALLGPTIQFAQKMRIAISGASMLSRLNGKTISYRTVVQVGAGDTLELRGASRGVYTYLAFDRTITLSYQLGSFATLPSAQIGGFEGRPLRKGDHVLVWDPGGTDETWTEIAPNMQSMQPKSHSDFVLPQSGDSITIFASRGPEFDRLPSTARNQHLCVDAKVGSGSSRMATLLESAFTGFDRQADEMKSSGVFPGVVQMNHAGQLMVLMRDGPTTGGYPRVAVIDAKTTWQLAQCPPGTTVTVEWSD